MMRKSKPVVRSIPDNVRSVRSRYEAMPEARVISHAQGKFFEIVGGTWTTGATGDSASSWAG
jgi:hypothetical protein